jgi:hypothetical protein
MEESLVSFLLNLHVDSHAFLRSCLWGGVFGYRKCTATSVNNQAIFPVWRLWMHLQPLSPAINVVKWVILVRYVFVLL